MPMTKFTNITGNNIMTMMQKGKNTKGKIKNYNVSDITSLYIPFRNYFITSRNNFGNDKNRRKSLSTIDIRMFMASDKDYKDCYSPDTYNFYIAISKYFSKLNKIMINYLHNIGILTKQGKIYKKSIRSDNKLGILMYKDVYDYLIKHKFLYKTKDFAQIIYNLTQTFRIYYKIANYNKNNLRGLYFAMYLLDYDIYRQVSILPNNHILSFSTYTLIILNIFSNLLNGKDITTSNSNAIKTVNALIDLIPSAHKINHIMQVKSVIK